MGSEVHAAQRTRQRWEIVGIWLITRVIVLGAAAVGSWTAISAHGGLRAYVGIWRQWDTAWYESIATYGYVGPYVSAFQDFHYNVAFFPGLPALMKVGMGLGLSATGTGLIVSLVASLIAGFGISRLTQEVGGTGPYGAMAFFVAPTALFVTAPYTEALFCALAVWAWIFARRQDWVWAGLLAGGAAVVRPNGLFLAIALVVMFALTRPRMWSRAWALLIPFIAVVGYSAYLRAITGDWLAWSHAERDFWHRNLVDPVTSLLNTYHLIYTFAPNGQPSSRMITEIMAMAVIAIFTIVLVRRRWWPESIYLLVTMISLGTSTMYHSVPRTLVVLFPIWMVLGVWMTHRRWLRWAYVICCLPILILVSIRYTQGQWIS